MCQHFVEFSGIASELLKRTLRQLRRLGSPLVFGSIMLNSLSTYKIFDTFEGDFCL